MALRGEAEALKKLNRELKAIKGRTIQGMAAAATLVKGRSQAKTPVDEGNLKASHYTATGVTLSGPVAEVGCTADYAIYVHEDLEANHTVGQAKFLESALNESKDDIVNTVRRRARIA